MPSTGNLPAIYQEEFTPIFDKCYEKRNSVSNVRTAHTYYLLSQKASFANVLWHDNTNLRVPGSYQTDMLTSEDISALLIVYKALYPHIKNISVSGLHNTIKKFASIFLGSEKFGSKAETRSLRSARVLASWNSSNGLIRATAQLSPGIVDYFMCHKVNIDGMERESITLPMFGGSRSIHINIAWVVLIHCVCGIPITMSQGAPVAFYLYTEFTASSQELIFL